MVSNEENVKFPIPGIGFVGRLRNMGLTWLVDTVIDALALRISGVTTRTARRHQQ
jgi:hypothetical protein